jgi:hypothetical protein
MIETLKLLAISMQCKAAVFMSIRNACNTLGTTRRTRLLGAYKRVTGKHDVV